MSILTFGDELLSTGDLDPVYLAMNSTVLHPTAVDRLCLAYWCFYSLGTAAYIAEHGTTPEKFWDLMMLAAYNDKAHKGIPTEAAHLAKGDKPWPRGAERRHFRGANAVGPMSYLKDHYKTASAAVQAMIGPNNAHVTFKWVAGEVEKHPGFGPWMSFKIADMAERVLGRSVDFHDCALDMFKDPTQGAAVGYVEAWSVIAREGGELRDWEDRVGVAEARKIWNYPITSDQIKLTVDYYVKAFNKRHKVGSVPGLARPLNIQEIETVFCKYKSHLKGHYPPGKDMREIRHGLQGWGKLADKLAAALPK